MIYDYLLVVFRLFVGFLTKTNLILFAFIGILIYLLWIFCAIFVGVSRKFNRKCEKLIKFVDSNEPTNENLSATISMAKGFSLGLSDSLERFRKNGNGFPSNYISKNETLENEINGGMLNHGKSFMKLFINISTIFIFILNLAFLGKDDVLTATILAQSVILPLCYFIVLKLFYFLYNTITQQIYKMCQESFSRAILTLDEKYGNVAPLSENQPKTEEVSEQKEQKEQEIELPEVQKVDENLNEKKSDATEDVKTEIVHKKTIDDYDFFKKKNIDVEKLKNENQGSSSVLPYIDVDSDYVIKDYDNKVNSYHPNAKNGSEVLGGMIHDMTAVKRTKADENDSQIAVNNETTKDEIKTTSDFDLGKNESENKENFEDVFSGLKQFEVENTENKEQSLDILSDAKPEENKVEENKTENSEKSEEEKKTDELIEKIDEIERESEQNENIPSNEEVQIAEEQNDDAQQSLDIPENQNNDEFTQEIPENNQENETLQEDNESKKITNLVGKFRSKSKLSSGGVEIERNINGFSSSSPENKRSFNERKIQILNSENDAGRVINSVKNSTSLSQEQFNNYPEQSLNQNYLENQQQYYAEDEIYQSPQSETQNFSSEMQTYSNNLTGYDIYGQPVYGGYVNQPIMPQNNIYNQYNPQGVPNYSNQMPYQDNQMFSQDSQMLNQESQMLNQEQPKSVQFDEKLSKANENKIAKVNDRAKRRSAVKIQPQEDISMSEETKSKRGRPAKQNFDENVSIKDDNEFEQVLSRAEKLMKKSEQSLSPSQAKRVEKELKTLLDAMNRYKEGK